MEPTITHEKAFGPLLEACAELVYNAQSEQSFALPQAAVLHSCLLIEAAANCCLQSLGLPRSLYDELDRLPSLTKYEIFLLAKKRGITTLDRSDSNFRGVRELKRLRDIAVHPKSARIEWEQDDNGLIGYSAKTDYLRIPRDPSLWRKDDAITAFRAANAFLDDFFRERCKISAREIRLMLFAPDDDEITDWWITSEPLVWARRSQNINLLYAGIR